MNKEYKDIIAKYAGLDADMITEGGRLAEDYGLDSMKKIELLTEIEDTYDIRFRPDEDDMGAIFQTAGTLWECVKWKKP